MSKRKRATAPKHAHSTRIAAKAQRARQAVVRSPKQRVLRSGGAGATERPPKRHNDPQQDTLFVENPEVLVEAETALQDDSDQMRDSSKKGSSFYSTGASVWAYQAKLLELAQANMQFAFEFARRLATIRSPAEFPSVIAEFTSKRIAMFRKHSTELAELSTKRLITSTGQSDPNKACSS
jgi:Phasin protein